MKAQVAVVVIDGVMPSFATRTWWEIGSGFAAVAFTVTEGFNEEDIIASANQVGAMVIFREGSPERGFWEVNMEKRYVSYALADVGIADDVALAKCQDAILRAFAGLASEINALAGIDGEERAAAICSDAARRFGVTLR